MSSLSNTIESHIFKRNRPVLSYRKILSQLKTTI